jgi:rubrerythrin
MQSYTQLSYASEDTKLKQLFSDMAQMERDHKAWFEDIYINMAFPDSW